MDKHRFDDLICSFAAPRRSLLIGVLATAIGWRGASVADAKKRRKERPRVNQYGCIDVGEKCHGKDAHCCSDRCEGRNARSRCVAHNSGICIRQEYVCEGAGRVVCDPNDKEEYFCAVTTGNAAFCGDFSDSPTAELCRDCRRDRECQGEFGPGAACIVCKESCAGVNGSNGTACVPPATMLGGWTRTGRDQHGRIAF